MTKHIPVVGLVAAGFDPSGVYLLTISHSGRGVFSTRTWERVARDPQRAYPEEGKAVGIGPIEGVAIEVEELDYQTELLRLASRDGRLSIQYSEGTMTISTTEPS
jgi:hypothetical protein